MILISSLHPAKTHTPTLLPESGYYYLCHSKNQWEFLLFPGDNYLLKVNHWTSWGDDYSLESVLLLPPQAFHCYFQPCPVSPTMTNMTTLFPWSQANITNIYIYFTKLPTTCPPPHNCWTFQHDSRKTARYYINMCV